MEVEKDELFSIYEFRHRNILTEPHKQMIQKDGKEISIFVISCDDFIQLLIKWFFLRYLLFLG